MPLSPSATRELLEKLGHAPKRFLGQNFLVDGNIVRKSLELAAVTAGDRVVEVGPGVTDLQPGDHVSASFVPSCGRCRYCSSGRQNLCDKGAGAMISGMITDGTPRHFLNGEPVLLMAKLGTFSEYACVAEASVIKVDPDLPLDAVALVSCGVATGWGSATKRAEVRPGDTVVVR